MTSSGIFPPNRDSVKGFPQPLTFVIENLFGLHTFRNMLGVRYMRECMAPSVLHKYRLLSVYVQFACMQYRFSALQTHDLGICHRIIIWFPYLGLKATYFDRIWQLAFVSDMSLYILSCQCHTLRD